MTEEDIKQKAEEYTNKNDTTVMGFEENLDCTDQMQQAYIDGYHECQKEHEWHYVKDGDFPKNETEKEYLVALKSEYSGFLYEIDIWCKSLHCFASNNPIKVYAWKEIVLPKESE